jgi:hypothetical protein
MKITKAVLVSAVAALALASTAASAQHRGGGGHGHSRGGGGHAGASFGHGGGGHRGGGHWSGGGHTAGHWSGHRGGAHWSGGHWRGSSWGPRVGFYFGVPLFWGWPYWDSYYPYYSYPAYAPAYYGPGVVYQERVIEEPAEAETTTVPRAPGAPTQEPAYRNYCESAKAYYPKVTSCPEGWRFEPAPSPYPQQPESSAQ